jgi:competence protein ComGC
MKYVKNEQGFTLIEMLIVMLVLSVLLIITVPNVMKNQEAVNSKGCDAYVKMVEGQVQAYKLKEGSMPSMENLISSGFLKEDVKCPEGKTAVIADDGTVSLLDE